MNPRAQRAAARRLTPSPPLLRHEVAVRVRSARGTADRHRRVRCGPRRGWIVASSRPEHPPPARPSREACDVRSGDPRAGCRTPGPVRAAFERWVEELAPGAAGWLGSTAGVTDDGRFIGLDRFESEQAARRNSDRPEQGRWWAETSKLFTGDVGFRDSAEVLVDVVGDPDEAGFVQVIQGRSSDPGRARKLMGQGSSEWAAFRPDVIGSVLVGHDEGAYTMALYFTSQEEAREGERKEPPPDIKAQMDEMDGLSVGEPEFFDLRQPWLYSPR